MHLLSRKIAKKDLGTVYIFDYDRGRKKRLFFGVSTRKIERKGRKGREKGRRRREKK